MSFDITVNALNACGSLARDLTVVSGKFAQNSLDRDAHVRNRKIPRGARRRASKFTEIKMENIAFHAFHGKLASAR